MATLHDKAAAFRALHAAPQPLVLVNIGEVAGARVVETAGCPAVATSSAGIAWTLGYPDGGSIGRAQMLEMVRRIAAAVAVPVTADMEAGYGDAPDAVAETVRGTIAAGAVGINIEDGTHLPAAPLLDFALSVERIQAARAAADAAGLAMVVNARTDVYLSGGTGTAAYDETVRRANAYAQAGADCLFVPGVWDAEVIGRLVGDIEGPVNILARAASPPVPVLAALGVARISIGGNLTLAAMTMIRRAVTEITGPGTYSFSADNIAHPEMNGLMSS
jgi:2-methylisocitrate lyase-like PEP mutase family enzyme